VRALVSAAGVPKPSLGGTRIVEESGGLEAIDDVHYDDDGGGGGGKGAWARHSNQPAGGQVVVPVGTGRRPGLLRALDVSM